MMGWLSGLSRRITRRRNGDAEAGALPAPGASDPNADPGRLVVSRRPIGDEGVDPPSEAQILRRQRSEARLRELGFPTYAGMPDPCGEDIARLRAIEDVVDRCAALWHCGLKARILYQGTAPEAEQEECDTLLQQEIASVFTESERRFLANPSPDKVELAQYIWRFDALCVLLWALQLWDHPIGPPYAPPGTIVGNAEIFNIMGREGADPDLRPIGEILDLYDLTSRCFWMSGLFHIQGKPQPPGFNRDVLIEHRHALEWLLCLRGWDESSEDSDDDDPPPGSSFGRSALE